ncbi:unnamed protein product [Arctogadus glacialis]
MAPGPGGVPWALEVSRGRWRCPVGPGGVPWALPQGKVRIRFSVNIEHLLGSFLLQLRIRPPSGGNPRRYRLGAGGPGARDRAGEAFHRW